MTAIEHEGHGLAHDHHAPPPPPRGWRRLTAPGWLRVLWMTPLFAAIGFGLVVGIRALAGWDPILLWPPIITVAFLTAAPIGYLAGIGCFDYWIYYISGRPTRPEDHSSHGAQSWKDYLRVNTDHKVIGVQYVTTTIFFFIVGGLMAMVFRAELAKPGIQYIDPQTFNGLISVHASLMIFLFIIPAFAGLANYVVPLMLGAPDMAFPRLNALSFWMLPAAGAIMLASFFVDGGAFGAGWTGYAPLSVTNPDGNLFFQMGVQWAGASSIATALNFLVTIITMRAPGMTFWRMPLLVWANFTTSLLVVVATPFVAGSQFFAMFDRILHTDFFRPDEGGYVLGYQHIFWFYSHPAVYIMMLPGFGIVSEVISTFARKPIFGYRLMALSLMAILFLGFSVWAHHMFVSGMANWLRVPMMLDDPADRHPDRHQGLLVARDAVGGEAASRDPDALGARVRLDVHDRRPVRDLPRRRSDRHPRLRHVLHRRAHPLRAVRRLRVHDLRRDLLLVPEDDRPDVQRAPRQAPLLAHLHRLQPHVLPDALDRDAGDAAPGGRLLGAVRGLELLHLALVVLPRHVHARVPLQHDHELGARACRRREPVAGDDARVAGHLAAADLQLRHGAAGGRLAVRVRRSRREACAPQRRPRCRADGGADPLMAEHLLVVANETAGTRAFVEAVKERAGGDVLVTLVAPVNTPREGYVVYEDTRRASAGRRLDRALGALRDEGVPAQGFVTDAEPADAVRDALATVEPPVTRVLVTTHPLQRSGWLRRNVVDRIRGNVGDVPVDHVEIDTRREEGAPANVLVIANETVLGQPLLDAIRARAGRGPASFLIVSPQSDPSQGEHPEAERRLKRAVTELRAAGIDAHGQVAHPDPYAAAMHAFRDERTDEIIVSTFPGETSSSWLRGDLVGRLRKDTSVPVEHVTVTREQAGAEAVAS